MDVPVKILFMQSQTYFGADSKIHALIMEYLNKQQYQVHVALNMDDSKSSAASRIQDIPGIIIKPTNFGPSIHGLKRMEAVKRIFLTGIPFAFSFIDLARYIRRNNIDIIHCTEKPRDAFYGCLLAKITGAKCLIQLHVKAEDWISPYVQWAMRHADALVGVSKFVQESMISKGYPRERTHFVHNSLDIKYWDPDMDGRSIRAEFNIPANLPVLISISRLFYWKGHQELLQAMRIVKRSIPDFRLLIVGEDDPRGFPEGGSFSDKLKQITKELDLQSQVIFTGFRSDVANLLAASDIFAMPSFEEPFGIVFLEAMAMEKPVIALDNGGTKEVVVHKYCGLLSPANDLDELAKNIYGLIKDPSLRKLYGENGRKRVISIFTPERLVGDFAQLYHQLMHT